MTNLGNHARVCTAIYGRCANLRTWKKISLSILSFSKNASEEMFLASKEAFLLKE
jgi:hypothetical protein